jgi:hypothetical protein
MSFFSEQGQINEIRGLLDNRVAGFLIGSNPHTQLEWIVNVRLNDDTAFTVKVDSLGCTPQKVADTILNKLNKLKQEGEDMATQIEFVKKARAIKKKYGLTKEHLPNIYLAGLSDEDHLEELEEIGKFNKRR